MLLLRVLHVLGNVLWIGGGISAALAMAFVLAGPREARLGAAQALRKLVLVVVTPGMLLSLAAGLVMLLDNWSTLYAKAPWMHGKLTVGLIAAGFSGVLSGKLRRAASGTEVTPGALFLAAGVLALSGLTALVLVFYRFGS